LPGSTMVGGKCVKAGSSEAAVVRAFCCMSMLSWSAQETMEKTVRTP
jgi:hypothetical protein